MSELLQGAVGEITASPLRFAAEVAQAAALIALLAWAARRAIAKRLGRRRQEIETALREADRAALEADALLAEERSVLARAEAEGPAIVRRATEEAEREASAANAALEGEAEALLRQAREAVEAERSRTRRESAERLVRVTAVAARRYLDEVLTDAERRALMEKAIAESLDELARHARAPPAGDPT